VSPDSPNFDGTWTAGVASGTCSAFLRRLYAQGPRLGHLITRGVTPVTLERSITVVDIHALHDAAQRFVVGALLSRIFEEKQGRGREPLRFVVLDELNKYAPRTGHSPIKEVLVDIAARGRSLGVLLIGAQQSAGDVDGNIIRNAAVKIVGRLDAGETAEYRFLSPEVRERAARFLPGTMVIDQPLIPAPIPMRFPFPAFATCVAEGEQNPAAQAAAEADAIARL
jgi:DNA helicase HerA-like ATPase